MLKAASKICVLHTLAVALDNVDFLQTPNMEQSPNMEENYTLYAADQDGEGEVDDVALLKQERQEVSFADHYNVLSEYGLLVCACAKCGSTSLYQYLYNSLFGHEWPFQHGTPYVQDLGSNAWKHKFTTYGVAELGTQAFKRLTSVAFVRDPKERIVSSWMSKVTCACKIWSCNMNDRQRLVPALLRLAGRPEAEVNTTDCLDFSHYLLVLDEVRLAGKSSLLNPHFLPQQFGCFAEFSSKMWTNVTTIQSPDAASTLSNLIGHGSTKFPSSHASVAEEKLVISRDAKRILDRLTKHEYEALAMHPVDPGVGSNFIVEVPENAALGALTPENTADID